MLGAMVYISPNNLEYLQGPLSKIPPPLNSPSLHIIGSD